MLHRLLPVRIYDETDIEASGAVAKLVFDLLLATICLIILGLFVVAAGYGMTAILGHVTDILGSS